MLGNQPDEIAIAQDRLGFCGIEGPDASGSNCNCAHGGGFGATLYFVGDHLTRMSPTVLRGPHSAFPQSSDGQALSVAIAGEWLNHSWSSVSAISEEDRFGSLADAPPEDKALVSTDDDPFDD